VAAVKLVRDKMPGLAAARGRPMRTRVAADAAEFRRLLAAKLVEEAKEFEATPLLEELADVLEVVAAAMHAHGWEMEDLWRVAGAKREARGGFNMAIVLLDDA
jgi:predicted house-cleaning noncanonical NTP pyrophosphatase (MazG superfamily)